MVNTKLLENAKIPFRYWDVDISKLKPQTIFFKNKKDEERTISGKEQREWLDKLLKSDFPKYGRILIYSQGPDEKAMKVCSRILINAIERNKKVKLFNPSSYDKNNFKPVAELDCAAIMNLRSASTDFRIQDVVDFSTGLPCLTLFVAGGNDNPIAFYKKRLNLDMDGVIYFTDNFSL